jgi:hypothetical protein
MAAIREALARDNPTSIRHRTDLSWGYLHLAIVQAAAGQPDEALVNLRKAEQIVGRLPDDDPITHYNLACAYAQCSTGTHRGERGLSAKQAGDEAYADRAMAALRRAVAAGYANVALIRRDLDLDPLRPRRDFQELLMDLSFPADPFRR